jgi:hypothetical protein
MQPRNLPDQSDPITSSQPTTPAVTPMSIPTTSHKPRRKMTGAIIVLGVLGVLYIVFTIGLLFALTNLDNKNSSTDTPATNLGAVSTTTLPDYVKKYSSTLSSQYPTLTLTSSGVGAVPLYDTASGYFFTTYGKDGWSFSLEKKGEAQVVLADTYKTLVSQLETDGFTKYTGKVYADEWTGDTETATASYYENGGIVCKARLFEPRVSLSCVEASEVTNEAKKMLPFYTAFFEANRADDDRANYAKETVLISVPDETEKVDKYPEYERVNGGISNNGYGANIGFFRKNGGKWQYEATKQAPQECRIYNTVDLQKAYHDTTCYIKGGSGGADKNTTVGELYGT